MNVQLGRPRAALGNLTHLLDANVLPNALYGEQVYAGNDDQFSPVGESAFCLAAVVHTMLLRTDTLTGALQLFPGADGEAVWADAGFYRLRADGGLVVSAMRRQGHTTFVSITVEGDDASRVVEIHVLRDSNWANRANPPLTAPAGLQVDAGSSAGAWRVAIDGGSTVVLHTSSVGAPFVVTPVAGNASEEHWFGYNRPSVPLH